MEKCLYCGLPVKKAEIYNGIDIYICDDGHRTGYTKEKPKDNRLELKDVA